MSGEKNATWHDLTTLFRYTYYPQAMLFWFDVAGVNQKKEWIMFPSEDASKLDNAAAAQFLQVKNSLSGYLPDAWS